MPESHLPRFAAVAFALVAFVLAVAFPAFSQSAETDDAALSRRFDRSVRPFLKAYCLDCHGTERQEAKLNLSGYTSLGEVTKAHQVWEIVLDRLEANEMPPEDAEVRPDTTRRRAVIDWIRAMRKHEANRNAGDPGPVLVRRLSNAEYNYTIRDLTLVNIRPTDTFPVDPANESGFDNSGESLTMSPALLKKYLDAARLVADHLVLTPTDLRFAPHPVVTNTDRDKYCVKRIVKFYEEQPTDLAEYFHACWVHRERTRQNNQDPPNAKPNNLGEIARSAGLGERYTVEVWELLHAHKAHGPTARLQEMWRDLPAGADHQTVLPLCEKMRDYVLRIRRKLAPQFENLNIAGSNKGSQPFVLWKNRQYAAHRRKFDRNALPIQGDEVPDGTPPELVLPQSEDKRRQHLESIEQFCSIFPDAFYISERGRDYLGVPREKQEKGRLLSAGFHSMMGYFRDDGPLYELILDDTKRGELDRLWQELDYVASAPTRQYSGFLWFERTDSRFMRDPVFDFARAEDKSASSEAMIEQLAKVYLEKARKSGGSEVAIQAIRDYFKNINEQIRWVDSQRARVKDKHLSLLLRFAEHAWRRHLSEEERRKVREFYNRLSAEDRLSHEEAIRDSVVSILMSPHFCFRMDLVGNGTGTRRLTDFEVASRLSYFLWSTEPDSQLWDLLNSPGHRLEDPTVVREQALRMLDDRKIRGLATEFAANWLDVRRFEEHNSVDRERFPAFTDELRAAMFEEPMQFFVDLVRSDRSVLQLLSADYTFANNVLAEHYGIHDIEFRGDEWRRIEHASRYDRGGLLPMSVFLTKNAPGLRTSPVKRGYWVVRRLLGERIPPPPPDVPELPNDESKLGDLSLTELLAKHRDHKACAGCHDRFDSIGVSFESFGPIGEQRTTDLGGRPIEQAVTFPDGSRGNGLNGLRDYLQEKRQQEFVENFCRKLLSYGLGRTLQLSDDPLIAEMQSKLKANDYRFSTAVEAIVTSRQFLYKRGGEQLVKDNR